MGADLITANLHDLAFLHLPDCSVHGKSPQHIKWVRGKMNWSGVTVFTDTLLSESDLPRTVNSTHKVGWLMEPIEYRTRQYAVALDRLDTLDLLLTHDLEWIEAHPHDKIRWVPFGGSWVKNAALRTKTKRVCQIMSGKHWMPGHIIRHEVMRCYSQQVDCYGWGSPKGRMTYEEREETLGAHEFCVVVENSRRRGFFTEKLLDCFATGTVPIYWGCPNIGDYFDTRGIILFETVDQLDGLLGTLDYAAYRDGIAENFQRFKQYEITDDWIALNVLKDYA